MVKAYRVLLTYGSGSRFEEYSNVLESERVIYETRLFDIWRTGGAWRCGKNVYVAPRGYVIVREYYNSPNESIDLIKVYVTPELSDVEVEELRHIAAKYAISFKLDPIDSVRVIRLENAVELPEVKD